MRHLRLESCGSTNDEAKEALTSGERPPLLVSTAHQTAGRGREGRSWSQPPGNFAGSFLLAPPPALASEPGIASLVSGLATAETLGSFGASEAGLTVKWPNDVLLHERKVAGILSELVADLAGQAIFVIGIGVNLAKAPPQARFPAAAVFPDNAPGEEAFGERLGEALLGLFSEAEDQGTATLLNRFRASAWRFGQEVTVRAGEGELRGVFADLDPHGRMQLRLPSGALHTISAGDTARR